MADTDRELALEEYKALIQLNIYEGTEFWSRFNYLFTVNGAILGAIALTLGLTTSSLGHIAFGIIAVSSLVGFVASAVWLFASLRSNALQSIWVARMREIEESEPFASSPNMKVFKTHDARLNEMSLRYAYRRIPLNAASYLIPIFLMLAYASIQELILAPVLVNVSLSGHQFGVFSDAYVGWLAEGLIIIDFFAWGIWQTAKYQHEEELREQAGPR